MGTADEVRERGRHADVRRLDLTDLPAATDVIDELADELGSLDVLVNNAGLGRGGPILEISYEDWRHTLSVDLDGAFLCAQRVRVSWSNGGEVAGSSTSLPCSSTRR
jgi:NAD(P)-dependent dehydrogenase (short-subunit alcohol dehydrogenase family)